MTKLTLDRLKELVTFCPDSGMFYWNEPVSHRVKSGDAAGSIDAHGYRVVCLDSIKHKAHRVAWFYVYGELAMEIDHINGVRSDNSIANLRICTHSENMQNKKLYANNKLGLIGVSAKGKKWGANINVAGKRRHLGAFDSPQEAHAAYLNAKKILHPFQPNLENRSAVTF